MLFAVTASPTGRILTTCLGSYDLWNQTSTSAVMSIAARDRFKMNSKAKLLVIALSVASPSGISGTALAQQPVGSGGVLQQIPPPPVPEKLQPELPGQRQETAPAVMTDDGIKVRVRELRVTGNVLFPEAELIAATDFKPDSELNLSGLRAMAAKIVQRYNDAGYFLARAYLPAQDIENGRVTIAVIEGHYGRISVQNESRVSDSLINSVLGGLNSGDPVETGPLERRLLIISDIPGVQERATMAPGAAVGTSDLVVRLTPTPRVTGSLEADNWGNPYTGAYRLGATVNVNNLLGYGDVASVRGFGSTTGGLLYGRASYQAQVGDATVGVAFTAFDYHLGGPFTGLNATGREEIASVYASYPLIRSYRSNLYAIIDFDYRTMRDRIGSTSTVTDKNAQVVIAGLSGNYRDSFGGGGLTSYSVMGSFGVLNIDTPAARQLDSITARTGGKYSKLSGSLSRLQNLYGPVSLYGSIRGQVADKNLDISEKMELGGASGVRAYSEGEAFGDTGYIATLEARWLLPKWSESIPGQLQLIGFVETGYVKQNQSPWAPGPNGATRSGAGVGVIWSVADSWVVTATYAQRLGNQRATSSPDRLGRFWAQVVKYF
jgi:hemolysin activation/secretion protein